MFEGAERGADERSSLLFGHGKDDDETRGEDLV